MFPDTLSRYFGFRLTDVGGELYALSCAANSLVDAQIVSGHTNAVCIFSFTLLTNGRSAAAVNSEKSHIDDYCTALSENDIFGEKVHNIEHA